MRAALSFCFESVNCASMCVALSFWPGPAQGVPGKMKNEKWKMEKWKIPAKMKIMKWKWKIIFGQKWKTPPGNFRIALRESDILESRKMRPFARAGQNGKMRNAKMPFFSFSAKNNFTFFIFHYFHFCREFSFFHFISIFVFHFSFFHFHFPGDPLATRSKRRARKCLGQNEGIPDGGRLSTIFQNFRKIAATHVSPKFPVFPA